MSCGYRRLLPHGHGSLTLSCGQKDRLCVRAAAADLSHGRTDCSYISEQKRQLEKVGRTIPSAQDFFVLLLPSARYFLSRKQRRVFRAPARVTFGHSPKSAQKGCLQPKVSRLPARYVLWLSAAFTARSREFDFFVRSKGSSLRLRRCR